MQKIPKQMISSKQAFESVDRKIIVKNLILFDVSALELKAPSE